MNDLEGFAEDKPDGRLNRLTDGRPGVQQSKASDPKEKRPSDIIRITNIRGRSKGYLQTTLDDRLQVRIGSKWTTKKSHKVQLELRNVGSDELKAVTIQPAGQRLATPRGRTIDALRPGERRSIILEYTPVSQGPLEHPDPIWGENVPISTEIAFQSEVGSHSARVPIDYQFYAGWHYGTTKNLERFLSMAYADQPGLAPYVEEVRRLAEEDYGSPLDDTPAARIAASKAVSTMLRSLELTSRTDPRYIRGENAAFAYAQFPTETLYYSGDCEDFSILYGFFIHELGIPFAMAQNLFHVVPLVELSRRGIAAESIPEEFRDIVVPRSYGDDEGIYLPVDPTIGVSEGIKDIDDDDEYFLEIVSKASQWRGFVDRPMEWLSSAEYPPADAEEFGQSWLGAMTFIPEDE
jgi:hypothetical protein